MAISPTTKPSLLLRIRDPRDVAAWSQFVDVYGPLVFAFLQRQGLQDADASDVAQEAMVDVAQAIGGFDYQPDQGGFRQWLFTVVKNRLRKYWRDMPRQPRGTGDTQAQRRLLEVPAPESQSETWDETYQRRLFQYAAHIIRRDFNETTWQAFSRTAVHGEAPQQVARSLGMTVAAVYLAKARVKARVREQVRMLDGGFLCPSSTAATPSSSKPF